MFKTYTYSLSEELMGVLKEAFDKAFGEGSVSLIELTSSNIRGKVRLSAKDDTVLGVFLNIEGHQLVEGLNKGVLDSGKYCYVEKDNDAVNFLNSKFNLEIPLFEEIEEPEIVEDSEIIGNTEISEEINKLKEIISSKEGIIINYKAIIEDLSSELKDLKESIPDPKEDSNIKELLIKKDNALEELNNKHIELQERVSNQSILITSLEDSVEKYKAEAETVDGLNTKLTEIEELNTNLENKVKEYQDEIKDLNEEIGVLSTPKDGFKEYEISYVEDLKQSKGYLDETIKENNTYKETIKDLNKDVISLNGQIRELQSRCNESKDTLELLQRAGKAERELETFLSSPFGEVYNASKSSGLFEIRKTVSKYENIKFLFTANQGYEKEFYRLILGISVLDKQGGYVFVDAVNSSFADYVFGIKSVVDSIEWFNSGGDVNIYLSNCQVSTFRALIPTLGYLNDGFFLTIDWEKRLEELNNIGKPILLYGGSLSSLVGKYLFSLFNSNSNDVKVFIQGSLVFARNGLIQTRGIKDIEKADICVFNINSSARKLLGMFKNTTKFREIMSPSDLKLRG